MKTFTKAEKISKQSIIDRLFGGGNRSVAVFPLRAVYMVADKGNVPVSVLVSAPKRKLHHAVDRNRFKRQVREAYRCSKGILWELFENGGKSLFIAFVCLSDHPCDSELVSKSVVKILHHIKERMDS